MVFRKGIVMFKVGDYVLIKTMLNYPKQFRKNWIGKIIERRIDYNGDGYPFYKNYIELIDGRNGWFLDIDIKKVDILMELI